MGWNRVLLLVTLIMGLAMAQTTQPVNNGTSSTIQGNTQPVNNGTPSTIEGNTQPVSNGTPSTIEGNTQPVNNGTPSTIEGNTQPVNNGTPSAIEGNTQPVNNGTSSAIQGNTQPVNNGTPSAIKGRYLIHDRVIRQDQEYRNIDLKNGSQLKQKITKMELIDIIHEIPDDENYVMSKVFFYLYTFSEQLHGRGERQYSNKQMLQLVYNIIKKNKDNKYLSRDLLGFFKSLLKKIKETDLDHIHNEKLITFFQSSIRGIQNIIMKNVREGRMEKGKMLLIGQVNKIIEKVIAKSKGKKNKSYYYNSVVKIVKGLLALHKEQNQTIIEAVPGSVKKAASMYNVENKKDEKTKIFELAIRTLSLIGYRLEFPKQYYMKTTTTTETTTETQTTTTENSVSSKSLMIPIGKKHFVSSTDTILEQLPAISGDSLRMLIRQNTRSGGGGSIEIFNILMKAIEREERRKQLRSIYPQNMMDIIKTNRGRPSMITNIIEKYKTSNFNGGLIGSNFNTESFTEKKDAILFDRFENELLETLEIKKVEALSPETKTDISNRIIDELNSKDLGPIKKTSFNKIKTLAEGLGLRVKDDSSCNNYIQCLETTKSLRNELLSTGFLQTFITYRNEKLYDVKFASNIVSNRTNRNIQLFKTLDAEYERNGYVETNLPEVLNAKQHYFYTMVNYYAYLRKLYKVKPSAKHKIQQRIFFNPNPMKPNSILYRQSMYDMGYIITLDTFPLIDASVECHVELDHINSTLLQELKHYEVGGAPYINKGDKLAGQLKTYDTLMMLEFITTSPESRNVKVWLLRKSIVDFACFSVSIPSLNLKISGEIKGVNFNDGRSSSECTKLEWEVKKIESKVFDPNAFVEGAESLVTCNV